MIKVTELFFPSAVYIDLVGNRPVSRIWIGSGCNHEFGGGLVSSIEVDVDNRLVVIRKNGPDGKPGKFHRRPNGTQIFDGYDKAVMALPPGTSWCENNGQNK